MEFKDVGALRLYRDRNFRNIDAEFPLVRTKDRNGTVRSYPSMSPSDYRFFGVDVEVRRDGKLYTLYAPVFSGPMISIILDLYRAKLIKNDGVVSPSWKWSELVTGLVMNYAGSDVFTNAADYVGPLVVKGTDRFYSEGTRRFWVYLKRDKTTTGQDRYELELGYTQDGEPASVMTRPLHHRITNQSQGTNVWGWLNPLYDNQSKEFQWERETHKPLTATPEHTQAVLDRMKARGTELAR